MCSRSDCNAIKLCTMYRVHLCLLACRLLLGYKWCLGEWIAAYLTSSSTLTLDLPADASPLLLTG